MWGRIAVKHYAEGYGTHTENFLMNTEKLDLENYDEETNTNVVNAEVKAQIIAFARAVIEDLSIDHVIDVEVQVFDSTNEILSEEE